MQMEFLENEPGVINQTSSKCNQEDMQHFKSDVHDNYITSSNFCQLEDINDINRGQLQESVYTLRNNNNSEIDLLDLESGAVFIEPFYQKNVELYNIKSCNKTNTQFYKNLTKLEKQNKNLSPADEKQSRKAYGQSLAIDNIKNENKNTLIISNENHIKSNNLTTDSENVIYRNKTKEVKISCKPPKKRVSFHEDILKNTRTDNIHIEHGFITYENKGKGNLSTGRHSWCSNDTNKINSQEHLTCWCTDLKPKSTRLQNACSDVLDYENFEIYENEDIRSTKVKLSERNEIFHSNSNPNLNSTGILNNSKHFSFKQESECIKSSSSDCIGYSKRFHSLNEYCYFSEPSIDQPKHKFLYIKESKPKINYMKKCSYEDNYQIEDFGVKAKMRNFNVHELKKNDKTQTIFGSFKNIFTNLPERGIPEDLENLQLACECALKTDGNIKKSIQKTKMTYLKNLSKSLDGQIYNIGNIIRCQNNFIHNVDEQLRKNKSNLRAPLTYGKNCECYQPKKKTKNGALEHNIIQKQHTEIDNIGSIVPKYKNNNYRNKYIINCVSTVYEHTGVSLEHNTELKIKNPLNTTPVGETLGRGLIDLKPLKHAFVYIFKSIKESVVPQILVEKPNTFMQSSLITKTFSENNVVLNESFEVITNSYLTKKSCAKNIPKSETKKIEKCSKFCSFTYQNAKSPTLECQQMKKSISKNCNHIQTIKIPVKESSSIFFSARNVRITPDLFDCLRYDLNTLNVILLNNKLDNMMRINTIVEKVNPGEINRNPDDMIMFCYPYVKNEIVIPNSSHSLNLSLNEFLKSSQSDLIKSFVYNVTKKKLIKSPIKNNVVFANKIKKIKSFEGSLYIKAEKPLNQKLIEDFNAKIKMEIETSGVGFKFDELIQASKTNFPKTLNNSTFQLGIDEIPSAFFNGHCLHLLNNKNENIIKVFKLYAECNSEKRMSPVLLFLTNRALYVRNLVGNYFCNKYVLKYSDLEKILIGPHRNAIIFSSISEDTQVLLVGGSQIADDLVSNLEFCIRQGGFFRPNIAKLTLEHLNLLQSFVRKKIFLRATYNWVYYGIISDPSKIMNIQRNFFEPKEQEFLIYKRHQNCHIMKGTWNTGFFVLKTGILYIINDYIHKLPVCQTELIECEGFQSTPKISRSHRFETFLKLELLQAAGPNNIFFSKWFYALNQIETIIAIQKKKKFLGCPLIMSTKYLVILRETTSSNLKNMKTYAKQLIRDTEVSRNVCTMTNKRYMHSSYSGNSLFNKSNSRGKKIRNFLSEENVNSFISQSGDIEILSYAVIKEITNVWIPSTLETWWCILKFSRPQVEDKLNDLVIFFLSYSEMQQFLNILEHLWHKKNVSLFPLLILDKEDVISKECTNLFTHISKAWIPFFTAAFAGSI